MFYYLVIICFIWNVLIVRRSRCEHLHPPPSIFFLSLLLHTACAVDLWNEFRHVQNIIPKEREIKAWNSNLLENACMCIYFQGVFFLIFSFLFFFRQFFPGTGWSLMVCRSPASRCLYIPCRTECVLARCSHRFGFRGVYGRRKISKTQQSVINITDKLH